MRWLRKVWDGPFKTPPLQQPISVGWVLLKIFESLWRLFLVVCLLVASGLLAIWISTLNPLSSRVRVEISDSAECRAKGYPIRALITNRSSKTLGEVDVELKVYPRGKSENVASYLSATHELRDILGPHERNGYCLAMPELEPGSTGPYTVAANVTYASELSKDVPVAAEPATPPPIITIVGPERHPSTKRSIWAKAGDGIFAFLFLGLLWSGGYGLIGLVDRAFKTKLRTKLMNDEKSDQLGCIAVLFAGLMNAMLVDAGSYGLDALGWGGWITQIDVWSRAKGYSDGGIMLLTALVCQWPWAILLALPSKRHVQV
jgi:hypothetical protein